MMKCDLKKKNSKRHTFSKLHEIKNLFWGRDNFFSQPSNKYPSLSKMTERNSKHCLYGEHKIKKCTGIKRSQQGKYLKTFMNLQFTMLRS